jgi:hypothetical protein
MEVLSSSDTSVLTTATPRNILQLTVLNIEALTNRNTPVGVTWLLGCCCGQLSAGYIYDQTISKCAESRILVRIVLKHAECRRKVFTTSNMFNVKS